MAKAIGVVCGLLLAVAQAWSATEALVDYWAFDESDGQTAYDGVAGLDDQVLGGAWVPGVQGNALAFDGLSTYVWRAAADMPDLTNGFSIEAWVFLNAYPSSWCPFVNQHAYPTAGFFFGLDGGGAWGLHLSTGASIWQVATVGVPLPLGVWQHIVGTFDPNDAIRLYRNGEEAGVLFLQGAMNDPRAAGVELRLGLHNAGAPFLNGVLDELKLYGRPLTADEVVRAYLGEGCPTVAEVKFVSGEPLLYASADLPQQPAVEVAIPSSAAGTVTITSSNHAVAGEGAVAFVSGGPRCGVAKLDVVGVGETTLAPSNTMGFANGAGFLVTVLGAQSLLLELPMPRVGIGGTTQAALRGDFGAAGTRDLTRNVAVRWSSDDTNVASVDAAGVVTVVGAGATTIRAEYETLFAVASIAASACFEEARVAEWPFDEGEGNVAHDVVAGLEDIIVNPLWEEGVHGKALLLDGFSSYVSRPAADAPSLVDGFSIETWVYLNAYPSGWAPFVNQHQAPGAGFFFGLDQGGVWGLHLSTGGGEWQVPLVFDPLPLGEWQHIAGTFSPGDAIRLYRNGSEVAAMAVPPGPMNDPRPGGTELRIGMHNSALSFLNARLDGMRIYNRPLAPAEVRALATDQPCGTPAAPAFLDAPAADTVEEAAGAYARVLAVRATAPATVTALEPAGATITELAASASYRLDYTLPSPAPGSFSVRVRVADAGGSAEAAWVVTVHAQEPESVSVMMGDANGDGRANIADAIYVLGYLFNHGPAPRCMRAADANGDAALNIADAVKVLGFLFSAGPLTPPGGVEIRGTTACTAYEASLLPATIGGLAPCATQCR
jgi:hypothetical protein